MQLLGKARFSGCSKFKSDLELVYQRERKIKRWPASTLNSYKNGFTELSIKTTAVMDAIATTFRLNKTPVVILGGIIHHCKYGPLSNSHS